MKILCNYTPAGPHYVRTGWGRVFRACGHDFKFWRPESKSAFDAFTEFNPDLYIGTTYEITRAVAKCIAARPNMRVILFASAWGPLVNNLDRKQYPLVIADKQEQETLRVLKETTGKPDFVFIHVTDRYLEGTMGDWRTIGIEPVGILNAADTFDYLNGRFRPDLECSVGFVGGYWGYKARNLDRFLLPLCQQNLNVKIFGNGRWPVAQYLGVINDNDVRDLFVSATVCPNISEPHSTDLGWDTIERPFKVLSSGGFCISDYVHEMEGVFGECVPFFHSPEGLLKMVNHYMKHPHQRDQFIQAGRAKVLAEHTYFDRVAQMLTKLGMSQEADTVREKKKIHVGTPC